MSLSVATYAAQQLRANKCNVYGDKRNVTLINEAGAGRRREERGESERRTWDE
jgi:hypothetical protein